MSSIPDWCAEHAITEVEAFMPDLSGVARGKIMPTQKYCEALGIRLPEAIVALGTAATAAPDHPRYAYVHAIALQTAGRLDEAIAALQAATQRSPDDPGLTELLVDYLVQQGDVSQARSRAAQYQAKWPDSQAVQRWRQDLLR